MSNTTINSEKLLVPKLRFQGFEGEWIIAELGKVAKVTSGGTPSRNNPDFWNGSVPWVTTSLIDFNVIVNSDEHITNEAVSNSSAKMFPKGTILMAMYGQGKTRGKVAVLGIDATTNQACGAILPNKEIEVNYLFQNLAGRYDEIRELSNEGGQKNLSGGIIKSITFSFPTLPEQQKIASFLSAVDEKIQQLTKKKELLQQYKKGVMQQLFSGKLRFKDENGNYYPQWVEKRLGDLVERDRKIRYGIVQPGVYDPNGRFMIRGQDYSSVKGWADRKEFFKVSDAVEKKYQKARVKSGDLLITIVGAGTGWLEVVPEFLEGANITQTTGRIAIDKKITSPGYVKNYFFSFNGRKEIGKYIKGQAQPGLNIGDVEKFIIPLPCLEEQQKIANYLSVIDNKIEAVNQQITKSQTFKKGLLQQMFV